MRWRSLALVAVASACGGAGVTGTAPPQTVLSASFQQGADNTCTLVGQTIAVGVFPDGGTASPTPVKSGEGSPLGQIGATCSVHPSGLNTYTVDGTVTAGANTIFTIHGSLTTTVPDGGIPKVDATLGNNASPNVSYGSTDGSCTVIFQTSNEGVTDGRVWGLVTCPKATSTGAAGTCQTVSEFRFEDCAF